MNESRRGLHVALQPPYAERRVPPSESGQCLFSGRASAYLELLFDVATEAGRPGLWLFPSAGARVTFEGVTVEPDPNVAPAAAGRRLRGWPLGPRDDAEDAIGLYLTVEGAGLVLRFDGEEQPWGRERGVWIEGRLDSDCRLRLAFSERGLSVTGLSAIRASSSPR